MNELDALLKLRRGLAWVGRKAVAVCDSTGGVFFVAGFVGVVMMLLFWLGYMATTGEPLRLDRKREPEEDWVERDNRISRENQAAAVKACLAGGGVPIFGSSWHGKLTDCRFPPGGSK